MGEPRNSDYEQLTNQMEDSRVPRRCVGVGSHQRKGMNASRSEKIYGREAKMKVRRGPTRSDNPLIDGMLKSAPRTPELTGFCQSDRIEQPLPSFDSPTTVERNRQRSKGDP